MSGKGRPSLISKQEIIECALGIGLSEISMHSLGKHLGVSATALYRHVSSKEDLIVQCSDYIISKVDVPKEEGWDSYLYRFARNFRAVLLSMPGSVEFIRQNHQLTPSSSILVDDMLRVFLAEKFDVQVGFMAFATVFTRVTDVVQHQEQSMNVEKKASHSDYSQLDASRLPHLTQLLNQVEPVNYEQYFEDSLKITMEGLKAVYR